MTKIEKRKQNQTVSLFDTKGNCKESHLEISRDLLANNILRAIK